MDPRVPPVRAAPGPLRQPRTQAACPAATADSWRPLSLQRPAWDWAGGLEEAEGAPRPSPHQPSACALQGSRLAQRPQTRAEGQRPDCPCLGGRGPCPCAVLTQVALCRADIKLLSSFFLFLSRGLSWPHVRHRGLSSARCPSSRAPRGTAGHLRRAATSPHPEESSLGRG